MTTERRKFHAALRYELVKVTALSMHEPSTDVVYILSTATYNKQGGSKFSLSHTTDSYHFCRNNTITILGGSIAGLTLAHCLRRANIDHVVLEKRTEIAPQEGAFLGIWPNGASVLDQLGLYDELEKLTTPIHRMHIAYPDGFSFSGSLPKIVHERFGYPIVSLDRQKVLEILYQNYPDKSKIHVRKRVTEVRSLDHGAHVITEDGAVYDGDLVVGADGIHSHIRSEIWRQADAKSPGLISSDERRSFTVEYACVFGISSSVPGLNSGEHVNSYSDGFCVITFHGKDGRVFWFIIEKLPQRSVYPNTPRFTPEDAVEFCDRLANVRVWRDVNVGDLWRNREVASMTALEEGLLSTWHLDRMVLLGDSVHKMTPNIGQGANTAIEDAAVLASLINKAVNSANPDISNAGIDALLREFHTLRVDRVRSTFQRSYFGARFHTRDDLLKTLFGRYVFPYIGTFVAAQTEKAIGGGNIIDFLPLPKRGGAARAMWSCPDNAAVAPIKLPATVLLDRVLILALWSLCLRSAGCVWNDVIDMDLDRQIARTKLRPLPRGAVSPWSAVMLTTGIFACGGSLLYFLPRECAIEALIKIFFALLYPFGKRFTDFPQLILVNIGWAIPMSMHSVGLDPLQYKKPTFCMFLFIALVIVMVDVVYSRQDTEEDVKVGVKSMAVRFKDSIDALAYALFYASTGALLAAGVYSGLGLSFRILSVGGHFVGFLYFLKATGAGNTPHVESYAKLACLIASLFWVVGLLMEYCLRV
ncbi:hypothetical protein CNMCM5623_004586 [Aspergillus felis]|uniref:FAD-binding domain-containing protein n=1 Tax=Aspergillus felis TaxID=1287682 RepID=A0A8H6QXN8_9EURO|nr:hypothetical protein CNMCM5623_004586 [Aspergillus felis]KAF7181284.1 hypothetical protein CNMCM7691_000502 [Aspergillus felis]